MLPDSMDSGEELVKIQVECDQNVNKSCQDKSLEQIAEDVMIKNKQNGAEVRLEINILLPLLTLRRRVNFSGLDFLSIRGMDSVINCTSRKAGIIFSDIASLVLNDVTVTNCGAEVHTAFTEYSSAVSIIRCQDVSTSSLVITRNKGTGLIIVDHHGGRINISSSEFTDNTLPVRDPSYFDLQGGGGVFIGDFEQDPPSLISIQFDDCLFEKNVPFTRYYSFLFTDDLGETVRGDGRGGGLYIALERSLSDVHIAITNCNFTGNQGFLGGGLSIEIEGGVSETTENITVMVEESTFERNGCSEFDATGIGGGAHLTFNTFNRPKLTSSWYVLSNVNFINNCAELGGGVYFFSNHELVPLTTHQSLVFDECTFKHNCAHTGSAVDITPNIFDRFSSGFLITPVFRDCTFADNTVVVNSQNSQTARGIGTIYASLYNVRFDGYNRFLNNFGTALNVVDGVADFSNSSAYFFNNTGVQGGAVALIGSSALKVGPNLTYTFSNNVAQDRGGGIYIQLIDNHDFTISRSCFIQYADAGNSSRFIPFVDFNANITFVQNRAEVGIGHAIFATSFHPCQVVSNSTGIRRAYIVVNISEIFTVRGMEFDADPKFQPQVSTDGAELRTSHDQQFPLRIIPGEQYRHHVRMFDDVGNLVNETLRAAVSNKNVTVFSSCLSSHVTLSGTAGQRANLSLQTYPPRQSYIELEIELVACPPGFVNREEKECVCDSHAYVGLLKCDTNILHSYMTRGF